MSQQDFGSDDSQFTDFRKRKNKQLRQRRQAEGHASLYDHGLRSNAARAIEECEQREAQDMQLKREMSDFVRDTTKLAAGVLSEVAQAKGRQIEEQVSGEIEDFFESPPAMQAPSRGPSSGSLRATQSLHEHLEKQNSLGEQASLEDAARYAEGLVQDRSNQAVSEPAAPHMPAPRLPAVASTETEYEAHPMQSGSTQTGAQEYTEFSGDALSEFCDLDDAVAELPDDPAILDDSVREFERISHLEPSCSDDDLKPAAKMPGAASAAPIPKDFAKLVGDPDRCKKTLTCLVNGGLLDREQARSIYAQMKEIWVSCLGG